MSSEKLDFESFDEDLVHLQRKVFGSKKKKFKEHSNKSLDNFTYKRNEPYRKPKQKLSIMNFDE